METISALLALCVENSRATDEFPSQRLVTWSFDVFFDLRLNKRLGKQSRRLWFETPSHSLWRHCNALLSDHQRCSLIFTRSISQEVFIDLIRSTFLKITILKLPPHLPGANELIKMKLREKTSQVETCDKHKYLSVNYICVAFAD